MAPPPPGFILPSFQVWAWNLWHTPHQVCLSRCLATIQNSWPTHTSSVSPGPSVFVPTSSHTPPRGVHTFSSPLHSSGQNWRRALGTTSGGEQKPTAIHLRSNELAMGRCRNTMIRQRESSMSHPIVLAVARPSARRLGAALDSSRRSQISKRETSGTADRGADTLVPVKTHQTARRGCSWAMAPCPRPAALRRMLSSHSSFSRTPPRPPVCSAPGSQKQKTARCEGTCTFDLYFAPLSSFPAGWRFPPPLHLLHPPPQQFVRALCLAAPRTLHARPRAGRGRRGEGGRVCLRQREKYLERVDARRTAHSHLGRGDGV